MSIQKFSNIFWGPEDIIKINRDEVVWTAPLKNEGQLAELLRTNPNLTSPVSQNQNAQNFQDVSQDPNNILPQGGKQAK